MDQNTFSRRLLPHFIVLSLGIIPGTVAAAGFSLIEQSGSGMGNAFAGGAAFTDDASAQYFNPASMMELNGSQFSVAAHDIRPSSRPSDATAKVTTLGGISYTGSTDNGGVNAIVPNLYFVSDLNPQTKFGLGITVPFGLSTDYSNDWIGRYHGIKSSIETININPAIAFKVNDRLSVGGGVSAQYIKAELTSAIDSASICLGAQATGSVPAGTCAGVGLGTTPGNSAVDSYAKIKGDNWGYGFNLGLLFKPMEGTRIGAAYRSSVKQKLTGDATFTRSTAFNTFLNAVSSKAFVTTSDSANLNLPAILSVSAVQAVGPKLEVMGDVTWTQWNKFKQLRVTYGNAAQPDSVTTEDWRNTLRYSVGLSYKMNDRMKLRSGVAYDQTPIPDDAHRTVRLPDSNRTWLAFGLNYAANQQMSVDAGYAHLFMQDSHVNNTTEAAIAENLQATYKSNVNILSVQLNYKF
ncbi:MAG: OmpP1/FadL family transporter [Sulfuricaulis sp.]